MGSEENMSNSAGANDARKPRWFRLVGIVVLAGVALVTIGLSDETSDYKVIFRYITLGVAYLMFAIWFGRHRFIASAKKRWGLAMAPLLVAGLFFALFKPAFSGDMVPTGFRFRFSPPADAALPVLGSAKDSDLELADLSQTTPDDYPRFLGATGVPMVMDIELDTDWSARPPQEIWRQPIGAGWSAFSIVGDYAVTQEQRDNQELVACYELHTGKPVWTHADEGRFVGFPGGDGPRATPTIHEGKVYSLGAFGILNCLDGSTGNVIWSKDILQDNDAVNLEWGKSSSPLIVDNMVLVSAGGTDGGSLVAYDKESGEKLWSAGDDRSSYASPVLATLEGDRQILTVNEDFVRSHRVDDGQELWRHKWPGNSETDASNSQPVVLPENHVFLSKGYHTGSKLLKISRSPDGKFESKAIWTSSRFMSTKFTNVVIQGDYLYGLSDVLLECIDWRKKKRMWKARGDFGYGQILLVGNQLLILTETGEVVLAEAAPERYVELGRFQAIEGKTWNNPALSGPYLLVRNHEEAACYKLPLLEEDEISGDASQ